MMHDDLRPAGRSLVLVDEPVEGDRRVARSLDALPGAETLDIRDPGSTAVWRCAAAALNAVWSIATALFSTPLARKRRIALLLQDRVRGGPADGLVAAYTWTYRAIHAAQALKPSSGRLSVVHAHDLYCGLCAIAVAPDRDCRLIYDAHELEIHRNRRAGWLRILVEHHFEGRVLRRADQVIVVNHAIAEAMQTLYAIPASSLRIDYNDFYSYHPVPHPGAGDRPCIVYVGKGVRGRQLERLDRPEGELGFAVHGYFLGKDLPVSLSGRFWRIGPVDYEADLVSLAKSRRCLMWCCLDAHALSYSLALPNKFFQALAVGIPVIASSGTYLAELVDRYRLGVVLDGVADFTQLARRVQSGEFEQWVGAVETFRDAFRQGAIVI